MGSARPLLLDRAEALVAIKGLLALREAVFTAVRFGRQWHLADLGNTTLGSAMERIAAAMTAKKKGANCSAPFVVHLSLNRLATREKQQKAVLA